MFKSLKRTWPHFFLFFLSNCLTGKGWVTPLRALLSAIFYGVWGLRFLASVGKLCLKSLYFMWNTTGIPHCGSSSLFLCKMIRLVANLLFCFLVSLFKPDVRQRWVMFRCGVGKLCPPELLTWWELLRKTVMIMTTKVATLSFTSIWPGIWSQVTGPWGTITSEPAPLISFKDWIISKNVVTCKNASRHKEIRCWTLQKNLQSLLCVWTSSQSKKSLFPLKALMFFSRDAKQNWGIWNEAKLMFER